MSLLQSSFPGPINGPFSANPPVRYALICLHGFGSSGDDLITFAPALQLSLGKLGETLAVYSPHAPAFTPGDRGRQWFRDMGWTFRDESGLQTVTAQLDAFIGHVAAAHNIPTSHVALMGFSQGAMTSLYAFPALTNRPAALISCAGTLSVTPSFPPNPDPEPILFLHGADDDVLPADTSVRAADVFKAHGYPTQLEILENLGHGIDARTLAHIAVFLNELWNPDTAEAAA